MTKQKTQSREKIFTVKSNAPKESYTKVTNRFIDEIMHVIKPNEIKILLIFMRSKDDFCFTMPQLAKKLGTSRQNLYNQLREMTRKRLIFKYVDSYEVNHYVTTDDLKFDKFDKRLNRVKGKTKAAKTRQAKKITEGGQIDNSNLLSEQDSSTSTVIENNTPAVLNNNTAENTTQNQGVLNSITPTVLKYNTTKKLYNSQLERDTEGIPLPNKTNSNNTNYQTTENKEKNNSNINSTSVINKSNSFEVVLQNPQFFQLYDYGKDYHWKGIDLSNFSDDYIAHIVIEKRIENKPVKEVRDNDYSLCVQLCQFSLKPNTPPNNLAERIKYQLTERGMIDKLSEIARS